MLLKRLKHKHRQQLYNEICDIIDCHFKIPTTDSDMNERALGYNRALLDLSDAIRGRYIRERMQYNRKN